MLIPLLGRQLGILGRAPSFRLLFAATLGSGLGTWLAFVALTVDVYDRTGSGVWVGALLVADFLPMVAIGLLLGPLVDRFSRRGIMIASDVVRFAVFCVLPFATGPATIVALAAVAGFATGFFRPAVYAGLPNLVVEQDLPHANSLLQAVENLTWSTAPIAAGLLVAASGPDPAYVVNAVTFLVSAALLLRVPAHLLQSERAESESHWRGLGAGISLVRRSPALLTVLLAWGTVMVASGGISVAEVVLAKVSFDSGDFGFGLLVAGTGFGLTLGSLAAGTLLETRRTTTVYAGSIGLMAVGTGAAAASPNVWVAAVAVALAGFGNGAAVVCNALFVQRGAPDRLRGRAFTLIMSAHFAVYALALIVAGPLTDAVGPRAVWAFAAAASAAGAVLALVLSRRAALAAEPSAEDRVAPFASEPDTVAHSQRN